jgi:hypothetical protein
MTSDIDSILTTCVGQLVADPHDRDWCSKERNWVSYFTQRYLINQCHPGSIFHDPAQIAIEVGVAQPPGYVRPPANRDLVVWAKPGSTCWNEQWSPSCHPIAIVEWKVHRPGHRNVDVIKERLWLRRYCAWQPDVVAYAIEIDWTPGSYALTCARFSGTTEQIDWLYFVVD